MTDYDRVRAVAAEIDKHLRADDPKLAYIVEIDHEDGSHFKYDSAYIMFYYDKDHADLNSQYPGEWIMVFTEHHGIHVFPREEVHHYEMYERKHVLYHKDYPEPQWVCDGCHSIFIEPCQAVQGGPSCPQCYEQEKIRKMTDADREDHRDPFTEYLRNVAAFILGEKVVATDFYSDSIKLGNSGAMSDKEPDENFMRSIEEKMEIPEQGAFDFRRDLMSEMAARKMREEPEPDIMKKLREVCQ